MKQKKTMFKGTLSIGRVHSNMEPDYATIRVEDETSGVKFIEIKISIAEFGQAVLGLSSRPCEYELCSTDLVGKTYEHETREVWVPPFPGLYEEQDKNAAKFLKRYEKDGWFARASDATNHHRFVRAETKNRKEGSIQRVLFGRYVDTPPPGKAEQ